MKRLLCTRRLGLKRLFAQLEHAPIHSETLVGTVFVWASSRFLSQSTDAHHILLTTLPFHSQIPTVEQVLDRKSRARRRRAKNIHEPMASPCASDGTRKAPGDSFVQPGCGYHLWTIDAQPGCLRVDRKKCSLSIASERARCLVTSKRGFGPSSDSL